MVKKIITTLMDSMSKFKNKTNILIGIIGYGLSFSYFLLLTGDILISIVFGFLGVFLVPYFKNEFNKRKKNRILLEFQDFIYLLNSQLKAGKSLDNGLVETKNSLFNMYGSDTCLGKSLEKIIYFNKIGIPYEKGFKILKDEYKIQIFEDFADIISIARKKGGGFNQILRETNIILGERMETEREIGTLLAKQKMEIKILRCIPFLMLLVLKFLYPEMISFLTGNLIGIAAFLLVLLMFASAFYISNKFMEVIWD